MRYPSTTSMSIVDNYRLRWGKSEYIPIMVGGMGVDISASALALEASRLGGIGHISDAMGPFVSDRYLNTKYTKSKSMRHADTRNSLDKTGVHFDLEHLHTAQVDLVGRTMNAKTGDGAIYINVMEKLTMASPSETLKTRLHGALDGGIDGITLSAGLHNHSMKLMSDNPRFRDARIGIIVSSLRAFKIFLRRAVRVDRLPDYVIVEGPLAGGHLGFGEDWREYNLKDIFIEVIDYVKQEELDIVVIPAGGVFTGTDAVEYLEMGAGAVQVATRFTITDECGLPAKAKQVYFNADEEDVEVSMISPTGYPIRLLKESPCNNANIKPQCEPFGYILGKDQKCQYLTAYENTPVDEKGKKLPVKDKMCICYHFSKHNCYTCGHYVYRLKDTSHQLPDGSYQLLTAEHVFNDYLYSKDHQILLPEKVAAGF
jgi:nitronate monooxygenase